MPHSQNPVHTAIDLVSIHGRRARQIVADHILAAVRNHDMFTAKQWNEIGCAVDERLDKAELRRIRGNDNERTNLAQDDRSHGMASLLRR